MRITVKRVPEHAGHPAGHVSNWLHEHAGVGSILQVTHPFGDFAPDAKSDAPIVLLSAGVGITPMIAVLNRIAATHPQREVIFAHAARSAAHQGHRADLAAASAVMPNLRTAIFLERSAGSGRADAAFLEGRMDIALLPQWDHADTDVYLCGPVAFMQTQWHDLLAAGVPAQRLHREVFGPELLDYLQ
jgi:nitric oxide dioxygenase